MAKQLSITSLMEGLEGVFPSKVRPVPVAQMRVLPANVAQRDFKPAHANRIAANFEPNLFQLLVVNWDPAEGVYWIIDGQHRYRAVKIWDPTIEQTNLDCVVYTGLTMEQMAAMFLGINDGIAVNALSKLLVGTTAGFKSNQDIRRAVESNGQKISRRDGGISAVAALRKVYERAGDVVLGEVIRTLTHGFAKDPLAFHQSLIEGLGLAFGRYNSKMDERIMTRQLSELRQGARELLRRAENHRDRTGAPKAQCVAAICVEIYNKSQGQTSRAKGRLQPWFKQTAEAA